MKAERIRVSYGVSKAALHGLTRHVANAYGKQNVRCNAIALGMILTEAAERNVKPEMLAYLEEHNALARLGRTSDVAEVVAFLFSDEASFITGEVIAVDGGFTSHLPGPGGLAPLDQSCLIGAAGSAPVGSAWWIRQPAGGGDSMP